MAQALYREATRETGGALNRAALTRFVERVSPVVAEAFPVTATRQRTRQELLVETSLRCLDVDSQGRLRFEEFCIMLCFPGSPLSPPRPYMVITDSLITSILTPHARWNSLLSEQETPAMQRLAVVALATSLYQVPNE